VTPFSAPTRPTDAFLASRGVAQCRLLGQLAGLFVAGRRLASASVGSPFGSRNLVSFANGWCQREHVFRPPPVTAVASPGASMPRASPRADHRSRGSARPHSPRDAPLQSMFRTRTRYGSLSRLIPVMGSRPPPSARESEVGDHRADGADLYRPAGNARQAVIDTMPGPRWRAGARGVVAAGRQADRRGRTKGPGPSIEGEVLCDSRAGQRRAAR
jgi:hypothetical protein